MSKNSRLFYDNNNWENEKKKVDRELLAIKQTKILIKLKINYDRKED